PAGVAAGPALPGEGPGVAAGAAGAPEQSSHEGTKGAQPTSGNSKGMACRGPPPPPPSGPPFWDYGKGLSPEPLPLSPRLFFLRSSFSAPHQTLPLVQLTPADSSGSSSPESHSCSHHAFPPEYMVNPEYLEREPPKVYPGCSGVYPYHPFPMGFAINQSGCIGAPSPPGISLQRGFQHIPNNYGPGNAASVSIPDGGGDFHQGYYTPLPQFIPPSFLPGIHYVPPPLSLNMLAETTKEAHG
ncbi:hypothetical protein N338_10096, partial [Podiceps cristatus]